MLDVLTIGDIKLDTFVVLHDASVQCQLRRDTCQLCIEYGKKIPVKMTHSQIAGSAPNVAIALAKMAKKTGVLSVMGNDVTFSIAKTFLREHKVATNFITARKGRNSSFAAVINFQGESTQLVAHTPIAITLPRRSPSPQWVYVSELAEGYEPLYRALAARIASDNIKLAINPGPIQVTERKKCLFDLLERADIVFMNLREARELLGNATPKAALARLHKLGGKHIVITDSQNGAYAFDGTQARYAPMFPGKRIEATGAGDAFASGFLGAHLRGKTIDDCLLWGSVNAASVVGTIGPTDGLLSHTEILRRLKAHPSYRTSAV